MSSLQFEKANFPEFKVKMKKETAKSVIYGKEQQPTTSKKEKTKKSIEDGIAKLDFVDLFKTITNNQ